MLKFFNYHENIHIIRCKSSYIIKSCRFSKRGFETETKACTINFLYFDLKEVGLSILIIRYFQFFEDENDVFNLV